MSFASEQTITNLAAERWRSHAKDPRFGEVMDSLVRHLHAFAAETRLTEQEWFEATEFLTRIGKISNEKRKEFILLSDVLGLSMLVTLMNNRKPATATQPTLLGPFYIPDSPVIPYGGRLPAVDDEDGMPLFVMGQVRDEDGAPIAHASLDVWQTDDEGLYEAQLTGDEFRHRGMVYSGADGRFLFRTVAPVDYPIPTDGPVGQLLACTTISEFRPSHIHFKVEAAGHEGVVTHFFDRTSPKLDSDVVFGTRRELLVDFVRHGPGKAPNGEQVDRDFAIFEQDFVLLRAAQAA